MPRSNVSGTAFHADARSPARSIARQKLVALISAVHFGRVLDLYVRDHEPLLDNPAPKVIRTIKLAGISQPRPATATVPMKREIADLLDLLDRMGDGLIARIEVAHGVPLFVEVTGSPPII
jgi:hypothetical protein